MVTAVRHTWLLSRVLATLLALSLVLATIHVHSGDASVGGSLSAVMLSASPDGHGDTTPDPPKDACAACALMNAVQVAEVVSHSVHVASLQVVTFPVAADIAPYRRDVDLFRPPIRRLV